MDRSLQDRHVPGRKKGSHMKLVRRNPAKKLQRAYELKLRQARDAQRAGDIQQCAELTSQAEKMRLELQAVQGETT